MDVQPAPRTARRAATGTVLALACAAQFMVVLDVSVVNVALPSIRTSLGFGARDLQWVVNAYALAFAGLLLPGGRLADLYGRRRIFSAGLALFTAASLAGGLATAPGALIAARAAQGLGAAILAPATLTILTTTFPEGPRRTRALATWTAVSLAGGTAGNLIGGVLTEYLSWRWILLINVPVGAVALALAARHLTGHHASGHHASGHHGSGHHGRGTGGRGAVGRLDIPGTACVTTGLVVLTYAVTRPGGLDDPVTLALLAAGLAALAAFAVVESRFARAPLIPLRLFRTRSIPIGNAVMLLAGAAFQSPLWFFLTLYMQDVLHYGPLRTGAGFLPHTVLTIAVGLRLTPWLMRRADDRALVVAGALIAAAGFLWQSRITPGGGYLTGIAGPAVLISLGGGLLNTPLTASVTSGVRASDAGAASGLMNTAKQVGGVLGLAVLAALTAGGGTAPQSVADACAQAFLIIAAMLAVVAAAALALPARRDPAPEDA